MMLTVAIVFKGKNKHVVFLSLKTNKQKKDFL